MKSLLSLLPLKYLHTDHNAIHSTSTLQTLVHTILIHMNLTVIHIDPPHFPSTSSSSPPRTFLTSPCTYPIPPEVTLHPRSRRATNHGSLVLSSFPPPPQPNRRLIIPTLPRPPIKELQILTIQIPLSHLAHRPSPFLSSLSFPLFSPQPHQLITFFSSFYFSLAGSQPLRDPSSLFTDSVVASRNSPLVPTPLRTKKHHPTNPQALGVTTSAHHGREHRPRRRGRRSAPQFNH